MARRSLLSSIGHGQAAIWFTPGEVGIMFAERREIARKNLKNPGRIFEVGGAERRLRLARPWRLGRAQRKRSYADSASCSVSAGVGSVRLVWCIQRPESGAPFQRC